MITIRDLLEQGISLQGKSIIVRVFNNEKDLYENVLKVNDDLYTVGEIPDNKQKYLDKEIGWIYAEDNETLCIDIKER